MNRPGTHAYKANTLKGAIWRVEISVVAVKVYRVGDGWSPSFLLEACEEAKEMGCQRLELMTWSSGWVLEDAYSLTEQQLSMF